jgi:hemoglobin
MKSDITTRKDIELLVDRFYDKVKADPEIGYLFNEVAHVNWETHLPKMYDFWENILFSHGDYSGNPMIAHRELHQKSPMNEGHFLQWIALFTTTVDEFFEGDMAKETKLRAINIAKALSYKLMH